MEYPKRPRSFFKLSRKLPIWERHPQLFYFGSITVSMLLLFSKPIYDIMYKPPPTIDPTKLGIKY